MEISNLLQKLADHRITELPAYALQEPFRWIADVAVMDAFECGVLDLADFYFTGDDYRYRLEPAAKQRFLGLLREQFNSAVSYRGRALKWDTVIEQKTDELGKCVAGKIRSVDFLDPSPELTRTDNRELRSKVLSMKQSDARNLGIGKSTLHYLRSNARGGSSFRVSRKVIARLE